jgi:hypothetical protein
MVWMKKTTRSKMAEQLQYKAKVPIVAEAQWMIRIGLGSFHREEKDRRCDYAPGKCWLYCKADS